jgi:hypothetical protein
MSLFVQAVPSYPQRPGVRRQSEAATALSTVQYGGYVGSHGLAKAVSPLRFATAVQTLAEICNGLEILPFP